MDVNDWVADGPVGDYRPSANWVGFAWLVVLVAASLPMFWFGFQALAAAWVTPEYSHGPLIPLVSLYLFLRELRHSPPVTGDPGSRLPGMAVMLVGLAIALAGNLVDIPDIVCYALILWLYGLVLLCFGWPQGRRHWAPVLHLVFMLPLPQILYWKLSIFLQHVSSELGVWLVELVNIPVFLDGNIIDLGVYKLQVAEACSGLRYLFPILSFSYLFSILYQGPIWHKFVMLLSAAPITVLMNSFRIGMIAILVNYFGIEQAEGFLHFFEGWVIFLLCVGLLFIEAFLLQRLTANPKRLADAVDLEVHGLGTQARRIFAVKASPMLIFAALATAVISAGWTFVPQPQLVDPPRRSFDMFPYMIGDYNGSFEQLDPDVARTLAADDYLASTYTDGRNPPVSLFVAYYKDQTRGGGIHSPNVCLPNSGWEVSGLGPYQVDMDGTGYGSFKLNRAVIQNGMNTELVYYWFEQRGSRYTNDMLTKLAVMKDAYLRGRKDGAMIRFITPIENNDTAAADRRLQAFMHQALQKMPQYVPF